LLRWVLGAVFAYAGVVKLLDPTGFAEVIARYGLLPQALTPAAAIGLPALEVAAGLGLALDLRASLSVVAAMLLLFAGVLWWGVLAGLAVDCGCFSPGELAEHDALRRALYRDLIMLAMAAYLYLWRWTRRGQRSPAGWRHDYRTTQTEVQA
jgi:uncharacterized membrane protein YphA (DoxX/SURF4 family)